MRRKPFQRTAGLLLYHGEGHLPHPEEDQGTEIIGREQSMQCGGTTSWPQTTSIARLSERLGETLALGGRLTELNERLVLHVGNLLQGPVQTRDKALGRHPLKPCG